MTVITGALIQSEFDTTVSATDLEVIIDSAIDNVNSDAGTSIGYMTGTAGSKTVTVTGNQAAAIKSMVALKLASRAIAGGASSSFGLGGLSQSQNVNSSPLNVNVEQYNRAIRVLVGRSFRRA